MYIEALVTHPDWRQQGVATSLIHFAEQQARNLNREWMALTVTLDNAAAVTLYENEGYQRGHWRLLWHPGGLAGSAGDNARVILHPVFGPAAESAFRKMIESDQRVGDAWAASAMLRLISYDPYRQPGKEWIVEVDGKAAGYLHRHDSADNSTLYLAAPPDWWASPEMLQAVVMSAAHGPHMTRPIRLRFASSGHHDAGRDVFKEIGFKERPATTARMFKNIRAGQ
jgi:hypothetical protein